MYGKNIMNIRHVLAREHEAGLQIALLGTDQGAHDAEVMLAVLEAAVAGNFGGTGPSMTRAENGVRTALPGRPTGLWITTTSSGFDFR
jgi:hypothetical protein